MSRATASLAFFQDFSSNPSYGGREGRARVCNIHRGVVGRNQCAGGAANDGAVRGRGDRVRHHHQRLDREVRLRLPTPAGTRSERPRAGHGMDDLTHDLPSDACAGLTAAPTAYRVQVRATSRAAAMTPPRVKGKL